MLQRNLLAVRSQKPQHEGLPSMLFCDLRHQPHNRLSRLMLYHKCEALNEGDPACVHAVNCRMAV